MGGSAGREAFAEFFGIAEPKLRRALCSVYGTDVGSDASAEALAWGWQHWERVESMDNPTGYLFRVGQTSARRLLSRRTVSLGSHEPPPTRLPDVDPAVGDALAEMPETQRVAVLLTHGYGYRHREVADVLGCSPSTVANHVERGMKKLRDRMGVTDHV